VVGIRRRQHYRREFVARGSLRALRQWQDGGEVGVVAPVVYLGLV